VISQAAGLLGPLVPSFFLGDATGFLADVLVESADEGEVEEALSGGGKGADVGEVWVGLNPLWAGDRDAGFGAIAGLGGNFGLLETSSTGSLLLSEVVVKSSTSKGGGGGGGGSGGEAGGEKVLIVGFALGLATIILTVPSEFLRTRAAVP